MAKATTLTFLLLIVPSVLSWKPIPGPPTAFTLKQTHPGIGTISTSSTSISSSNGGGGGGDGSDNLSLGSIKNSQNGGTISYHGNGNAFLDEYAQGHTSIFSSDSASNVGGIDEGAIEDRILGGKFSYLSGNKFYGGYSGGDTCSVDKYALEYEGTLQYKQAIPKLDQFTLCTWMRFTNHSGDHTLFTYSVDGEPREIQFWVANSKGSSFISMAVHGQSLYRLNYPLRFRRWHHACTSWNGKTGEWQLWIKSERIGRGFHNRLVEHVIKPNGIAFSGGRSFTGPTAEGLHTEITMVQLYKIALSAGKAHRDHKHHHVHHFDHNGPIETSTPAPPPPQPIQPLNSLLANGQIPTRVRLNLAGAQNQPAIPVQGLPSQLVGGAIPNPPAATITTQFINGQFHTGGRLISEQLLSGNLIGQQQQQQPIQQSPQFLFPGPSSSSPLNPTSYANVAHPANVQFIDDADSQSHFLFKRQNANNKQQSSTNDKKLIKRETIKDDKKINKRGLVMLTDGSIIDDVLLDNEPFIFDGLAQFGAPAFKDHLMKMMLSEEDIKEYDREPAEGEVQAVMNLCSYCETEPFIGALVMAWKDAKISMDHVLKAKSTGGCGNF